MYSQNYLGCGLICINITHGFLDPSTPQNLSLVPGISFSGQPELVPKKKVLVPFQPLKVESPKLQCCPASSQEGVSVTSPPETLIVVFGAHSTVL